MIQPILLALVAGSTVNLALEDVLNDRNIPKPSLLLNFFLILAYIFLFFGIYQAVFFFIFALFLAIMNSKGYHHVGLGDVGIYLVFLQFNALLFFFLQIPTLLCFWLNKGRNIPYLPFIALYFLGLLLT